MMLPPPPPNRNPKSPTLFSGYQSAALFIWPFVWTDLVTTISHERLEQSQ